MKIGDHINIKVIIDKYTIINQTLTISFLFDKYIITCGHCLPSNSSIVNGKILYTSGFDTISEGEEIGMIEVNNLIFEYKLYEYNRLKKIYDNIKDLLLINNGNKYKFELIKIFNNKEMSNLEKNKTYYTNNFYWLHQIDKITDKKILFDTFCVDDIGIAFSEEKNKSIDKSLITLLNNKYIINDIMYYATEPSFSGSPIIYNNHVIGYHIGSTYAYKMNNNYVYWIGKIIYFKVISYIK